MLRISKDELAERWALTYRQDGYDVRTDRVVEHEPPANEAGVAPDLEALRGDERVLVYIIDSDEALNSSETPAELQVLHGARNDTTKLHVVVAAECASTIKERLDEWKVDADLVHVT